MHNDESGMQNENASPRSRRAAARLKYRPAMVKLLFVAESPPADASARYFYYEDVKEKDSLFLEMMKALYPSWWTRCVEVRRKKAEFLQRFCNDGCYLLDAVEEPLGRLSPTQKVQRITENSMDLLRRIREVYCDSRTEIVLISAPVFQACGRFLGDAGLHVANDRMIDFPGSGGQRKFRDKLSVVLVRLANGNRARID